MSCGRWKSSGRRDYSRYLWSGRELLCAVLESVAAVLLLSYFFYRSLWAAVPLGFVGILFFRDLEKRKRDACIEELTVQFKECILSVSASLAVGYAVENAFLESREDMRLLYGEHSLIYRELEFIRKGLIINITMEELLDNLAKRSGSAEIEQFAQVFSIAKRNGGNIPEIIRFSSELIGQRIEVRQEIRIVLSGRRMEQTIMKLMPFGILTYIGICYPGYFDSLYHNWQGAAIMSGCLFLYMTAYIMGDSIFKKIEKEIL